MRRGDRGVEQATSLARARLCAVSLDAMAPQLCSHLPQSPPAFGVATATSVKDDNVADAPL